MLYSQPLFTALVSTILIPLVLSSWIPSLPVLKTSHSPRHDSISNIPDFKLLSKYVCPRTNLFSRDTTKSNPSDLQEMLQLLRLVELQTIALIDELMLADASGVGAASSNSLPTIFTITTTSTATSIPLASLNSELDSVLDALGTTLTSTTTLRVTRTIEPVAATSYIARGPATTHQDVAFSSNTALPPSPSPSPTANSNSYTPSPLASLTTPNLAASSTTAASTNTSTDIQRLKYRFNASSPRNVAVYFGQTSATAQYPLDSQCADPSIDIVILAFVIATSSPTSSYPTVNFGAACGGQTRKMLAEAPGLLSCPRLAAMVQTCQGTYGKKVLLSIGGAASQIRFKDEGEAGAFADNLWRLFGPPGGIDGELRPFGQVEVDGFDVDNEDNLPLHFDTLASSLRASFATAQKDYYLSSAPQCPFPDASDPLPMLLLCDFVWVQFYNNPSCELGSPGFEASVQQWSTALSKSPLPTNPRLYIGAPAFALAGSTAYAGMGGAKGIADVARNVRGMENFGGVMFWDGPEGMLNAEGGKSIMTWAKEGLTS